MKYEQRNSRFSVVQPLLVTRQI